MKRASTIRRTKPLPRGTSRLQRTRLQPIGKQGSEDREAIEAARSVVMKRALYRCERCRHPGSITNPLHLHHRRMRSQGGGHEPENLSVLCKVCHDAVHAGSADSSRWIVTRKGAA